MANSEQTILRRLADFTTQLSFSDLPDHVVRKANDCVFDLVGCYFGALRLPENQAFLQKVASCSGAPEVRLWGTDLCIDSAHASLITGFLGYELEYDDGVPTAGHWGSASIPAVWFCNRLAQGDGRQLLVSVVAGYEVGTRVSRFFSPRLLRQHVHFPCTMGAFASIAGSSKALGRSAEQTLDALSFAGLFPQGTYSTAVSGGSGKSLYSGWPAFLGIYANRFVQWGLRGDADVLENPSGLPAALGLTPLSKEDAEEICGALGENYRIMGAYFKPYPCCRWLHAPVMAACRMVSEQGVRAEEIERVRVKAPSFALLYNTHEGYESKVTCQYSCPYSVAAALCRGRLDLDAYTDEARRDPQILDLAQRTDVVADEELDKLFPGDYPIRLEVSLHDGRCLTLEQRQPWSGSCPPSTEELEEKFRYLTQDLPQDDREALIQAHREGFWTEQGFGTLCRVLEKPLL